MDCIIHLYLFSNCVSTFTPPAGIDVGVDVYFNGALLGIADGFGLGQPEEIFFDASWLPDDEGTYVFVMYDINNASSCEPVQVTCSK